MSNNFTFNYLLCVLCFYLKVIVIFEQLGHGDYSASSTKVLRMVNTLAVDSEAKQTIETLQAELKKTKERLQAIEELKGQASK
jgi:mitotic spindle assembly checkpoint protein MAD1